MRSTKRAIRPGSIRTLGIWLLVCVAFQIAPWVLVAYLILVIGKHVVSR